MPRATCTWGDGPDVTLSIDSERFILYEDPQHDEPPKGDFKHGFVKKGSMDLTADEAEALGHQLINTAAQARGLDKLCEDHDEQAVLDELERPPIPKENLTCHTCRDKDICRYVRSSKMNLRELKEKVDRAVESAIEYGAKPVEIEVSLQIDTYGKPDVVCSTNIEAHYDNDGCASGFVLVGSNGYEA